ncbi:hypothetical protein GRF29_8g305881 [Pseudopithomyces chartarum]|uniref:Uncharacterized protein n=1 Tax=Pseudopithomyces chartarum TaxID=1892770 RepID=A0AAN6M5X3_9PLEO|nr:hypothetical protein GRF29_8g305881 [Pseudopithomyces chartarum]
MATSNTMTNIDSKVAPQGLNPLIVDQNTIEQEATILAALSKALCPIYIYSYTNTKTTTAQPLTSTKNNSTDPKFAAPSSTDTKPTATDVWVFAVDGKKGMVVNDALAAECREYGFTTVRWFKIGTYKKSVQERSKMYGAWDGAVMASCYIVEQVRAERAMRRGA